MADPEQLLWPLRAVSKDPANLTKLDADGNVITSTTDLDARYVNVTGDNMTGALAVQVGATFTAPATATNTGTVLHVVRDGGAAIIEAYNTNAGTSGLFLRRKQGTIAAPTPVNAGTAMGVIRWQTRPANGAGDRTTAQIAVTSLSPETQDGFYDGVISMTMVGAVAGQANSFFELRNLAATGTTATITANTFVCNGANFLVTPAGFVKTTGAVLVQVAGAVSGFTSEVSAPTGGDGTGYRAVATGTMADNLYGGYFEVGGTATGSANGAVVRARSTGGAVNTGIRVDVSGAATNYGIRIASELPAATSSFAILSESPAQSALIGSLAVGEYLPTKMLSVNGDAIVRTTLEVVGNITSAGTAHSFANGSIPSPAVIGNTPRTIAATGSAGSAGQMVWDDNFIYLRTTSGWKKVALTAI